MLKAFATIGLSLSCLVTANLAFADWQLVNDKSQLSFVSIKKGSVAETHHFTQLEGLLSDQGALSINVNLTSAETLIPIRNERLTKFVFEAVEFPQAVLTANLKEQLADIKSPGTHLLKGIDAELDFHGHNKALKIDVMVTRLNNGDLSVSSLSPVIIKGKDFSVIEGIETLQKLAGLPSIATAIPVTFALTFKAK